MAKSVPVVAEPTDVSDEASVKALFDKVHAKFGKAHVLVNSAGSMGGGMVGDVPLASWWADFVSSHVVPNIQWHCRFATNRSACVQETNVKGTFLPVQSFIQRFGGEGTIINLVSIAVAMAFPGISSYASSKLAVIKLGQALTLGT